MDVKIFKLKMIERKKEILLMFLGDQERSMG